MATRYGSRRFYPATPRRAGYDQLNATNSVGWFFALVTFTALVAAVISLNSFKVGGFPIRGFLTVAVLGIAGLLFSDKAAAVFRQNVLLLTLATALAVLGTFVSFVYGTPLGDISKGLLEVHLQAAVTILAAGILSRV